MIKDISAKMRKMKIPKRIAVVADSEEERNEREHKFQFYRVADYKFHLPENAWPDESVADEIRHRRTTSECFSVVFVVFLQIFGKHHGTENC